MIDHDDSRAAPTTPAPAPLPSEAPTGTDHEKPEPENKMALRPPPPDEWDTSFLNADDSVFSRAVMMVAKAGRKLDQERVERERAEGTAGDRHREQLEQQSAVLRAVEQADRNNTSGWTNTQAQIASFRAELVSHDAELKAMRAEIDQLKQKLAQLETRLDEKQAHGPARPPTATPAG